jgi:hypothetical protein
MIVWDWETFGIKSPAYPVRIVNDVMGTEHTVIAGRSRAEIIERLLWDTARSTRQRLDDPSIENDDPVGVCIYIKPDGIVIRFYPRGDEEAARKHLQTAFDICRAWSTYNEGRNDL